MTKIHLIGIGGTGLSAIARLLKESGYQVTGSDMTSSPFADDLKKIGIPVFIGHRAEQIDAADYILRSSAVPDNNVEVIAARQKGIPVYKRADFLGSLMEKKLGIAIAGTHGKTSTTAMLAWTLTKLGADPSFIVGSTINGLGVNARAGKGEAFLIEADEYDRMFLGLKPKIGIITNLEHDHPDIYPTFESLRNAFADFVRLLPAKKGALIACGDDKGAAEMLDMARSLDIPAISYGFSPKNDLYAEALQPNARGGYDCSLHFNPAALSGGLSAEIRLSLQVSGKHNILNALAVMSVIAQQRLPLPEAAKALKTFTGSGRRFELLGTMDGITVYDDYAHHPTEIRATLAAARARHPQARIWAVWQPHTYSRTRLLFDEFTQAFADADRVIITEIYRSREAKEDFSSARIAAAMNHPAAAFIASLDEVEEYLLKNLRPNDVLLILSAGDANQIGAALLNKRLERTSA